MPGLGDDIEHEMTGILSIDRKRDAERKAKKRGWNFWFMVIGGAGIAIVLILMGIVMMTPPQEPVYLPPPDILSLNLTMSIYPISDAHDQRVIKITHDSGPTIKNISSLLFSVYGPEESGMMSAVAGYDPLAYRQSFEDGDSLYLYQNLRGEYLVSNTPPTFSKFTDLANGAWKVIVMDGKTKYGLAEMDASIPDSKTHYVQDGSIGMAVSDSQWYDTVIVSGAVYQERLSIEAPIRILSFNNSVIDGGNLNTIIAIKSNDVEIAGFEIKNSGNKGFSDGAIVVYQTFSGAKIYNNYIHNGAIGVWLWGADHCEVTNNIIYENDKEGILLQNKADYNIITSNRVDKNGQDGIRVDGCDYNKVTDNALYENGGYGIYISDYSILHNICEYNSGTDKMYCNDEANREPVTPSPTPVIHSSLEDDLKNFRVWTDGPGPSK